MTLIKDIINQNKRLADISTVISELTVQLAVDSLGHVTTAESSIVTRDLTLGNLNFTGNADADKYEYWQVQFDNNAAHNMTSGDKLTFIGGTNIDLEAGLDGGSGDYQVTINGQADDVGHITQIEQGKGMQFTTLESGNATGTISIPSLTASLTGNVNATSGVSTFTGLKVNDGIGIGTDVPGGDKKLNIVDGALVGGSSLDSDKFVKIVNSIKL